MLDKNSLKKNKNMQSRFCEIKFKQQIYDNYTMRLLPSTPIFPLTMNSFKHRYLKL